MKKLCLILFSLLLFASILNFSPVYSKDIITDWYVKNFNVEIIVNRDSSLDITEKILADCGDLPNKHGIYRVIPYQTYGENDEKFQTPIKLISITDFDWSPLKHTAKKDYSNHTISWKIGDPNVTVTGENEYMIKYHVENAIRTQNKNFDELYWNLSGNFWELDIDNFSAKVIFPDDFKYSENESNFYSGNFGDNNSNMANFVWDEENILSVQSTQTLKPGDGITISVTAPKDLFIPYVAPWWERYMWLSFIIITFLFGYLAYVLWKKFGRDPKISPTIAPEFEIPENLPPSDMGFIYSDGILKSQYLTAAIINLAVKGYINIKQIKSKSIFTSNDYELTVPKNHPSDSSLPKSEKMLFDKIFEGSDNKKISDLKNNFYKEVPIIQSSIRDRLSNDDYIIKSSRSWQYGYVAIAIFLWVGGGFLIPLLPYLGIALIISGIIYLLFAPLMTRRSAKGAKYFKRIQGFELYMKKAERYRQQFFEKENTFEKLLPYAVMFGITTLWIKKMSQIYGEPFIRNYHPIWYLGAIGSFNIESFSTDINKMSSAIGTALVSSPSSSGSGGGGFSGGGGGGGGGGGW